MREFLSPEGGCGVSEAGVHGRSCCAQLWLPDFWHPKQELDRSAISSLLADCQSLVSSRASIRKTAFPRKISLSETLTIGPPSRKMEAGGGGGGREVGPGELPSKKVQERFWNKNTIL